MKSAVKCTVTLLAAVFVTFLLTFIVTGGKDDEQASAYLDANGYQDIKMTGYSPLACSKGYFYHSSFTALNHRWRSVHGVVCGSLYSRYDNYIEVQNGF